MDTLRVIVLCVLALAWGGAAGQALEHQVKAAFLFRFLSFVEWPAQAAGAPGTPMVIAVVAADDVHAELLKVVAGRRVNDRPVTVQRLAEGASAAGAHLVFVGRSANRHVRRLSGTPGVLLVAESEDALEHGALINFVIFDDRVRFEVAPDEAERRGLRIGARVLAVALQVKTGPPRP